MTALEFLQQKNLVKEGFTKFFIYNEGVEFDLGAMLDEYALLKNSEKKPPLIIMANGGSFEHVAKVAELMRISNVLSTSVCSLASLNESQKPEEIEDKVFKIHDFPIIETLPNYFEGRKRKPKNPEWQSRVKKLTNKRG